MKAPLLGRFLRAERQRCGLTLRGLSRLCGLAPATLSLIENDRGCVPCPARLTTLATVLGVDLDTMLHAAGRVPADVQAYVQSEPGMYPLLRRCMERGDTATTLAARLGEAR